MSKGTSFVSHGSVDHAAAEPFEVGTVQWLRRHGEGGRADLAAGYWFVSPAQAPAPFEIVGAADETIHIIEGHVTIDIADGPSLDLRPGSSASLNKGTRMVWTVHEPTVEFFVYS